MSKTVSLPGIDISNKMPIILIAGPCQIESRDHAMLCAEQIFRISEKLQIGTIFKSSFDKANRSSISGVRGIGLSKAVEIFSELKEQFGFNITTDVHDSRQIDQLKHIIDVIQIPAFLCRQTDLLIAAGNSGKAVNVKKGQFLAPWDMKNVAEKIASTGNENILLTERGVTFGYNRLINDMRGIEIMKDSGYPVIFDATHSVQEPGGLGKASGGERRFVKTVATAATAVGVAGLFIETHPDPENAPSDGPCMLPLHELESFIRRIMDFDVLAKRQ